MRVLLTGFEPFGGESINPSWLAIQQLPDRIGELEIHKLEVPTVFGADLALLRTTIEDLGPQVVICAGQAGGRPMISLERVAINLIDARIPDNAGQQPLDEPVVPDGPAAYFSTLPLKRLQHRLALSGIPAEISYTAGTFVCNHIFYGLMHDLHTRFPGVTGGFVHVPYLPEQVAMLGRPAPSMDLSLMVQALTLLAQEAALHPLDLSLPGGAIC